LKPVYYGKLKPTERKLEAFFGGRAEKQIDPAKFG